MPSAFSRGSRRRSMLIFTTEPSSSGPGCQGSSSSLANVRGPALTSTCVASTDRSVPAESK